MEKWILEVRGKWENELLALYDTGEGNDIYYKQTPQEK